MGLTSNVKTRLAAHNAGQSPHTSKYRPWRLCVALAFADCEKAIAFEQYLKTGSGWAFAKRHFW
jgi:predicted GIY-YIG superfamily endonuclease